VIEMGAELGKYKSCVSARSTDKEILKHAQDGGIVTQLFGFALDEGIIEGAIVAATKEFAHKHPEKAMMDNSNMEFHEPWRPIPVVVTTKEDLIAAAGTKYNISPNVSLIKESTRSFGLDKVGIVGTPCQMQAIRKGQLYPVGLRDVGASIALAVGIFCMRISLPEYTSARGRPRSNEAGSGQEDGDRKGQILGLWQAWTGCPAATQSHPQVRTARMSCLPRLCCERE
jgi:coenzyme F420-reducing hydrogenase beta subunit